MRTIKETTHPEQLHGEWFFGNADMGQPKNSWSEFNRKTKRLGSIAYDIYGKQVSGMRPVFVQIKEMESAGFTFIKLGKQK